MSPQFKEGAKTALVLALALQIILVCYSYLLGWSLMSLLVFWFIIVPWMAIYLPGRISKNANHLTESLMGLVIFYAVMIFMTYKLYKSDYFQVMSFSCGINALVVLVSSMLKRLRAQPR